MSDDPRRREMWRKRVERKHAQEEGWALEHTEVTVDEDSVCDAQREQADFFKALAGALGDGGGVRSTRHACNSSLSWMAISAPIALLSFWFDSAIYLMRIIHCWSS